MAVEFKDGMDFGVGIDTLQLKVRGHGVTESNPKPLSIGGGQTIKFSLLKVDSFEDYQSAFDFEAEAAATYGLFHGSAKFNFAESHRFHSFSKYLVASVTVTNAFQQIPDPPLREGAIDLLRNGRTDRFREEFGDAFVLGITTGGAYYAVLEFTSNSTEDLQKISAMLDVGEFGVFDGSASFSSAVRRFQGQTSLKVFSLQQGGTDTQQVIDVDGIIRKAGNFPAEIEAKPVPFSAELKDYKALDLPQGPNLVDTENARLVLQNFFKVRNDLVQKLNDIQFIQLHPEQFIDPEKFDLPGMQSQITEALNLITRNASTCVNRVMDCNFPNPPIPQLSLPRRIEKSGGGEEVGGGGGPLIINDKAPFPPLIPR